MKKEQPEQSDNEYHIRAEDRRTKNRIRITLDMSKSAAEQWKPTSFEKKFYRYFRVVKSNH